MFNLKYVSLLSSLIVCGFANNPFPGGINTGYPMYPYGYGYHQQPIHMNPYYNGFHYPPFYQPYSPYPYPYPYPHQAYPYPSRAHDNIPTEIIDIGGGEPGKNVAVKPNWNIGNGFRIEPIPNHKTNFRITTGNQDVNETVEYYRPLSSSSVISNKPIQTTITRVIDPNGGEPVVQIKHGEQVVNNNENTQTNTNNVPTGPPETTDQNTKKTSWW